MVDVSGRLLNELEEVHRESEAVVRQIAQARGGCAGLCLKSVEVPL